MFLVLSLILLFNTENRLDHLTLSKSIHNSLVPQKLKFTIQKCQSNFSGTPTIALETKNTKSNNMSNLIEVDFDCTRIIFSFISFTELFSSVVLVRKEWTVLLQDQQTIKRFIGERIGKTEQWNCSKETIRQLLMAIKINEPEFELMVIANRNNAKRLGDNEQLLRWIKTCKSIHKNIKHAIFTNTENVKSGNRKLFEGDVIFRNLYSTVQIIFINHENNGSMFLWFQKKGRVINVMLNGHKLLTVIEGFGIIILHRGGFKNINNFNLEKFLTLVDELDSVTKRTTRFVWTCYDGELIGLNELLFNFFRAIKGEDKWYCRNISFVCCSKDAHAILGLGHLATRAKLRECGAVLIKDTNLQELEAMIAGG